MLRLGKLHRGDGKGYRDGQTLCSKGGEEEMNLVFSSLETRLIGMGVGYVEDE